MFADFFTEISQIFVGSFARMLPNFAKPDALYTESA